MVIHFSFGLFFSSHGRSSSPFFLRREWKYVGNLGCPERLELDAKVDDG